MGMTLQASHKEIRRRQPEFSPQFLLFCDICVSGQNFSSDGEVGGPDF